MNEYPIHLNAYTTIDISDFHFFEIFIKELTNLFGLEHLLIQDTTSSKNNNLISLDKCPQNKRKIIYSDNGFLV